MAVTFFFVLSGFVLTYRYAAENLTGEVRRRFWIARFIRIYPTYFLALVCAAPIRLYAMQNGLLHYSLIKWSLGGILSMACVQAWLPQTAQSWNGPGWSISCEAFFYALFPALLAWLNRQTQRIILHVVVLCWILSFVAPTILRIAIAQGLRSSMQGWETATTVEELLVLAFPLFHLTAFLVGMATGRLFVLRGAMPPNAAALSLFAALLSSVFVCSLSIPLEFFWNSILAPAFAVMIYALCTPNFWTPILANHLTIRLGDASYALYIIQYPAFVGTSLLLQLSGLHKSAVIFAISFVLLVVISIVLSRAAERSKHLLLDSLLKFS